MLDTQHILISAFLLAVAFIVAKAEEDLLTKAAVEVKKLLEENDAAIRPSVNNEATHVKIQTFIRHIDVDEANDKITLDIILRLRWNDYRLAFNTEGVDYVTMLNTRSAWLPDPFFLNGFSTNYKSFHKENFLRVYPNGNITYSTRLSVNANCPIDNRGLNNTQTCYLKIASYGYTTRDILFEWEDENPAEFSKNLRIGNFSLDKSETHACKSKTATGEYSCVKLVMTMRRDTCS